MLCNQTPDPEQQPGTANTPPWTRPGWAGIFCIQSDVLMEPPVGIEPTTYSLRVNRSAD